jgi:hypothetical protein
MVCLKKNFVLMLTILLIVLGVLLVVEPCVAPVTVPVKPIAGPDIVSVEVHHYPVTYQPTYTTDPYSGEKYQNPPGRTTQLGDIAVKIKNRSFTSYTDKNGNAVNRYYCFFWEPAGRSYVSQPYCEYQSDSAYTTITFTYGYASGYTQVGVWEDGVSLVFRVQVVEGYFEMYSVFEGVGSEFVEFTVNIPSVTDKAGTTKPNINYPSTGSSTSNPDIPTLSAPYDPPPQDLWTTYLLIFIIATVCLITIPLAIVAYYYGQRRTKPAMHKPQQDPNTT